MPKMICYKCPGCDQVFFSREEFKSHVMGEMEEHIEKLNDFAGELRELKLSLTIDRNPNDNRYFIHLIDEDLSEFLKGPPMPLKDGQDLTYLLHEDDD